MINMVQKCPVCEGKRIVPGGFYNSTSGTSISNCSAETCKTCGGTGIISVLVQGEIK